MNREINYQLINSRGAIVGPAMDVEPCLQFLDRRVTNVMNEDLLKVLTREKVNYALK
jgi:hypothetical protein